MKIKKSIGSITVMMGITLGILILIAYINLEWLNTLTMGIGLTIVGLSILSGWYLNRISRNDNWIIKKGHSYSSLGYLFPWSKVNKFDFWFNVYSKSFISDEDLKDKNPEEKKQLRNQINKLFGPVWGMSTNSIHEYSCRLGFNFELNNPEVYTLFFYTYVNGKRVLDSKTGREPIMAHLQTDREYRGTIELDRKNNRLSISVFDHITNRLLCSYVTPVNALDFKKYGRFSLPYVENAPKKMEIEAFLTNMS